MDDPRKSNVEFNPGFRFDRQPFAMLDQLATDGNLLADLLQTVGRQSRQAMFITTAEPEAKVIFANPSLAKVMGCHIEEIIDTSPYFLQEAHYDPDLLEQLRQAALTVKPFLYPSPYYFQDGQAYIFNWQITPLKFDNDDRLIFLFVEQNPKCQQVRQSLADSEQKFRSLIEQSQDGISLVDERGVVIEWNEAMAELTGLEPEVALGQTIWDLQFELTPSEQKTAMTYYQLKESLQTFLATGQSPWMHQPLEREYCYPDGTTRFIAGTVFPIQTAEGFMLGSIARDITPQKETEKQIKAQADLLNAVEQAVIATDLVGQVTYWNQFAEKLYGWSAEEVIGQNVVEFIVTLESVDQARQILENLSSGQSWSGEFMVQHRDGTTFPIWATDSPIYDEQGSLIGIIGVSSDITARKQVEEELTRYQDHLEAVVRERTIELEQLNNQLQEDIHNRQQIEQLLAESREQYRVISELVSDYAYSFTIEAPDNFTLEWVTDAFTRITGFTSDDLQTRQARRQLIYNPDQPRLRDHTRQLLTGQANICEYRIITRQGDMRWIRDYTRPIWSKTQDRIVQLIGAAQDITDYKQTEKSLRQSEERFRTLFEYAPLGIVVTGGVNGAIMVNKAIADFLGYPKAELETLTAVQLAEQITHPDDWPAEVEAVKKLMAGDVPMYQIEKRYRRKDGTIVWGSLNTVMVRDQQGEAKFAISMVVDITKRKQAEQAIRESEQQLRLITDSLPVCIAYTDAEQRYRFVNKTYEEWFGWSQEAIYGKHIKEVIGEVAYQIVRENVESALSGEKVVYETRVNYQNAGLRDIMGILIPQVAPDGTVQGYYALIEDITERKQAEQEIHQLNEQLEQRVAERTAALTKVNQLLLTEVEKRKATEEDLRNYQFELEMQNFELRQTRQQLEVSSNNYRSLYELAPMSYFIFDEHGAILDLNQMGTELLGKAKKRLLKKPFMLHIQSTDRETFFRHCQQVLQTKTRQSCELQLVKADKQIIEAQLESMIAQDEAGQYTRIRTAIFDITTRKQTEAQLRYLAMYDALTDLPNRVFFSQQLAEALQRSKQEPNYTFAVLFLDCDRFKVVNDSLGHLVGDQVLVMMAHRLQATLDAPNILARFGGDEFTILLPEIRGLREATVIAQKIQQQFDVPLKVYERELFINFSIGIVLNKLDYDRPDQLIRDANMAMYRAKDKGKSCFQVFDTTMHAHALSLLKLETDLRQALRRNEFEVYYQPIVSLATGKIVGFEALVRWRHPERGLISPAQFISMTEETGLIIPLGRWVLEQACQQLYSWQQQFSNREKFFISVNLSVRQFSQANLVFQVDEILQSTHLPGYNIKLEITESVIMDNIDWAMITLQELKRREIKLSIDDFGTGYSSLSYLHRFPIDVLKIDRSFIGRIGRQGEHIEIVRAIITLAHNLGIDVVAEGVETAEQLAQLRKLQCEYGQGYFLSKPLTVQEAEALIASSPQW